MVLTDEEAKQFYDLWISLLDFVNQKYKLIKKLYGMTSPKGLPLKSVALISSRLWEDKDIIDEFAIHGKSFPLMACAWAKIYPNSLNRSIWKQKYN